MVKPSAIIPFDLSKPLTREAYEAACARYRIPLRSDFDCEEFFLSYRYDIDGTGKAAELTFRRGHSLAHGTSSSNLELDL